MPTTLNAKLASELRDTCAQNGIQHLYHFTPLSNLSSILYHGLMSVEELTKEEISYTYTDGWRNDGHPHAISLSVENINHSMFANKISNSTCAWAILEIDASVIWKLKCRFCWRNASYQEVVDHRGFLGGPWGFYKMFENPEYRETQEIPSNQTTRNDAEIQVLETIEPRFIRDLTVKNAHSEALAKAAMEKVQRTLPIAIVPEAFTYR